MPAFFWIISAALLLIGLVVSVSNWITFFNNYVFQKTWRSSVFLIGGVCGALGINFLPIAGISQYFWVPLILDWGSLPLIVFSLVRYLLKKKIN